MRYKGSYREEFLFNNHNTFTLYSTTNRFKYCYIVVTITIRTLGNLKRTN